MSERYPRFRIQGRDGLVLVREGLSFSFYIRRSHREVAQGVMQALEAYLRAVGSQALGWYLDEEGEPRPLDERGWERIRRDLREGDSPIIRLRDASDTEERYRFEYWGKDLEEPSMAGQSEAVCAVTFWLPTEFLEEKGPARVCEFAKALAMMLPLGSGHGGLSFHADLEVPGARQEVSRYCFRYPGLDVSDLPFESWKIGNRVRGAHWLTFLGQPVVGELGGAAGLRARLRSPGTTVEELDGGTVLIRLGEWPEAGDTEHAQELPAYRELARVLEPWLFHTPGRLLTGFEEDTQRWERRFLNGLGET